MQTRFNLIAAAILALAGLCSTISSHHIVSIFFYSIGIILVLAAFLSKDKKDKQIEEIHDKITNNQNKPTETSTQIIESYMKTAHKIEVDAYTKDVDAFDNNLASRGMWSSGAGVAGVKDVKLPHINTFVNSCLEYIESTKNNYLLDKPSVKSLFKNYQTTDITEVTETINNRNKARDLLIKPEAIEQEIIPPIISEINSAYNIALLRIDAM